MLTLREALTKSGWESFRNTQNEIWNTTDLIQEDESEWLDSPVQGYDSDCIIDCHGDELTEVK